MAGTVEVVVEGITGVNRDIVAVQMEVLVGQLEDLIANAAFLVRRNHQLLFHIDHCLVGTHSSTDAGIGHHRPREFYFTLAELLSLCSGFSESAPLRFR